MKDIIFILFALLFVMSCERDVKEKVQYDDVKEVMAFVLDSVFSKIHGENFLISPYFENNLSNQDIKELYHDTIFDTACINFMILQHNQLNRKRIADYVKTKYLNQIQESKPEGKKIYLIFDPPLFSVNMMRSVVFITAIFRIEGKYRWDSQMYLLINNNHAWEIEGYLRKGYE